MYGILFWLSYLNCWPWRQNKLHITVISKELLANNNVSQEWICIAAVMQHGRDCITEIVFILVWWCNWENFFIPVLPLWAFFYLSLPLIFLLILQKNYFLYSLLQMKSGLLWAINSLPNNETKVTDKTNWYEVCEAVWSSFHTNKNEQKFYL